MKKLITKLVLVIAVAALTSGTSFAAEGQNGNGGGGVNRNGRYMTFYSAGFYIEPNEVGQENIPQLAELLYFLNTTPFLSEMTKVKYASNLLPSAVRKYYRVDAGAFTAEVRARLIAEYGRVMKVNTSEVAIFAVTDTESKTTYLFPEFYSLKPIEQQAILFHETYWLLKPRAGYKEVINAEMAFQAYLEYPQSAERLLRWVQYSGTPSDTLVAAINTDLASGALNGLIVASSSKKKSRKNALVAPAEISLFDLFGQQFFSCYRSGINPAECKPFINTNIYGLSQRYPKSLFLKVFYDALSQNKVDLLNFGSDNADCFTGDANNFKKYCVGESTRSASIQLSSSNFGQAASLVIVHTFDNGKVLKNRIVIGK